MLGYGSPTAMLRARAALLLLLALSPQSSQCQDSRSSVVADVGAEVLTKVTNYATAATTLAENLTSGGTTTTSATATTRASTATRTYGIMPGSAMTAGTTTSKTAACIGTALVATPTPAPSAAEAWPSAGEFSFDGMTLPTIAALAMLLLCWCSGIILCCFGMSSKWRFACGGAGGTTSDCTCSEKHDHVVQVTEESAFVTLPTDVDSSSAVLPQDRSCNSVVEDEHEGPGSIVPLTSKVALVWNISADLGADVVHLAIDYAPKENQPGGDEGSICSEDPGSIAEKLHLRNPGAGELQASHGMAVGPAPLRNESCVSCRAVGLSLQEPPVLLSTLQPAFVDGSALESYLRSHGGWRTVVLSVTVDTAATCHAPRIRYNVRMLESDTVSETVALDMLRAPLQHGEAIEIYASSERRWLPAVLLQREAPLLWTHSACSGCSARIVNPKGGLETCVELKTVDCARRRFAAGEEVEVYLGVRLGWTEAVVQPQLVDEQDDSLVLAPLSRQSPGAMAEAWDVDAATGSALPMKQRRYPWSVVQVRYELLEGRSTVTRLPSYRVRRRPRVITIAV